MRAKSEEMGSHGQGGHNMQVVLAGFVDGVDWGRSVSEGKRRPESDLCFSLSNWMDSDKVDSQGRVWGK